MKKSAPEKTAARLVAVQTIYSADIKGENPDMDATAFSGGGLAKNVKIDRKLFSQIVEGTMAEKEKLDSIIDKYLDKGWTLEKLGFLLRAILRAAIYELKFIKKAPPAVVINEYVGVTEEFFDESDFGETGFVNAILDKISKED